AGIASVLLFTALVVPSASALVVPQPSLSLSGSILQSNKEPISDVTVILTNTVTQETKTTQTDQQGNYSFSNLSSGSWQISPQKQDIGDTNISASDAVMVLQAAVGIRTLSPEQKLVADVSGDGAVNAVDAVMILQRKVGLTSHFTVGERCNSDWLFIPSTGDATTKTSPSISTTSCQNGTATVSTTATFPTTQNFTAFQFGDVSGSYLVTGDLGSGGGGGAGGNTVSAQSAECSWYEMPTNPNINSDADPIPNTGEIIKRSKAPNLFGDGFLFSHNEGTPGGTLHKGIRCTTTFNVSKTGPQMITTGAGGSFLKVWVDDRLVRSTRAPDARLLETELSAGAHHLRIEYQHFQFQNGTGGEAPHPDWFFVGLLPVPDNQWVGVKYIDRQKEFQTPEIAGPFSTFLRSSWETQTPFVAVLAGNFDFLSAGTYTFRKDANGRLNLFANSFRDGALKRTAIVGNLPGDQQASTASFVVDNSTPSKSTGTLTLLMFYRSAGPGPRIQLRWNLASTQPETPTIEPPTAQPGSDQNHTDTICSPGENVENNSACGNKPENATRFNNFHTISDATLSNPRMVGNVISLSLPPVGNGNQIVVTGYDSTNNNTVAATQQIRINGGEWLGMPRGGVLRDNLPAGVYEIESTAPGGYEVWNSLCIGCQDHGAYVHGSITRFFLPENQYVSVQFLYKHSDEALLQTVSMPAGSRGFAFNNTSVLATATFHEQPHTYTRETTKNLFKDAIVFFKNLVRVPYADAALEAKWGWIGKWPDGLIFSTNVDDSFGNMKVRRITLTGDIDPEANDTKYYNYENKDMGLRAFQARQKYVCIYEGLECFNWKTIPSMEIISMFDVFRDSEGFGTQTVIEVDVGLNKETNRLNILGDGNNLIFAARAFAGLNKISLIPPNVVEELDRNPELVEKFQGSEIHKLVLREFRPLQAGDAPYIVFARGFVSSDVPARAPFRASEAPAIKNKVHLKEIDVAVNPSLKLLQLRYKSNYYPDKIFTEPPHTGQHPFAPIKFYELTQDPAATPLNYAYWKRSYDCNNSNSFGSFYGYCTTLGDILSAAGISADFYNGYIDASWFASVTAFALTGIESSTVAPGFNDCGESLSQRNPFEGRWCGANLRLQEKDAMRVLYDIGIP
ncbi:MAG TPA: carboxypeptidase regulatory-like domain-containing protein, partial [Candidatus Paceibacterota bacterium]